jgi:hypothetical protein
MYFGRYGCVHPPDARYLQPFGEERNEPCVWQFEQRERNICDRHFESRQSQNGSEHKDIFEKEVLDFEAHSVQTKANGN